MNTGQPLFLEKPMLLALTDQSGFHEQNATTAPVINVFIQRSTKSPLPLHNSDIQPSVACPRNFIIFDQTKNGSHVIYHPKTNSKPILNPNSWDNAVRKGLYDGSYVSSSFEEDSDEIDALLSSEYEKYEAVEDDEVSTARSDPYYDCHPPNSCTNYEPLPKKRRAFVEKSSGCEKERHVRMGEVVKALRGIVPGADRMNTLAVLDESVRYLRSLRDQVQKFGVENE